MRDTKKDMSVEKIPDSNELGRSESKVKYLSSQSNAWKSLIRTLLKRTGAFEIFYYPKERKMVLPEPVAHQYLWNEEYIVGHRSQC